uniref:Odorant-binding protein 8 n=1 Tax=Ceracris kiangsu TaxID=227354 RepID=A0A1C8CHX7_CERKI|nr:odorant-binding protein 8 [Ceracris kiangsu]
MAVSVIAGALGLLAAALATTVTTDIPTEEILRWVETCNKSHPISQELLRSLATSGGLLADESDTNARCYLECYDRLVGVANSDGMLNVENVVAILIHYYPKIAEIGAESVAEIVRNCSSKSGTGQCMTSYLIRKCYTEGLGVKSPNVSIFDSSFS